MEPKTLTYDDLVAMGVIGRTPVKAETFPLANAVGVLESQQPPIMRDSLPADVANDIQRLNLPPQDEKTFFDRIPKWNAIIEKLKDPMVRGPLETFFTALSAPMASWENTWSRLGRAAALYSMHKAMLEENARRQPHEDKMKEIEMQAAEAEAAAKKARAEQMQSEARVASATENTRIEKIKRDLENTVLQGDLTKLQMQIKEHELQLEKEFGKKEAEAKIKKILADVQESLARANLANVQAKQAARAIQATGGTVNLNKLNELRNFYSMWDGIFIQPYLKAYSSDPNRYGGQSGFFNFLHDNQLLPVFNQMWKKGMEIGAPLVFQRLTVPSGYKPGERVPQGYNPPPGTRYRLDSKGQVLFD